MMNCHSNESIKAFEALFDRHQNEILEDFKKYLSFQSISTQPEYKDQVFECCSFVEQYLKDLHFDVQRWETSGYPTIFGKYRSENKDAKTLLIYLHYDVQPVDPLEEWDSSPFEPTIKDDVIYARGASDNKGQGFYVLTALKMYWEKNQRYPINLKIIIEGEEEIGSPGLTEILPSKQEDIQADSLIIVDVDMPADDTPAITLSMRGITHLLIDVIGSNTDLHSGIHGGIVYNPLHALVEMLAALRNKKGEILVPGFYDDVEEPSKEEKKRLYLEFDEEAYQKQYQAEPIGGERKYPPMESSTLRPTLEINGIRGGYLGEGTKTVIPARAHAKLSVRLVPNQDPEKIQASLLEYLSSLLPEGLNMEVEKDPHPSRGVRVSPDSNIAKAASAAYSEVFEKPCHNALGGGSIPIGALLQRCAGAEMIAMGTALATDKIHAPNEHFALKRFKQGYLVITQLLDKFH